MLLELDFQHTFLKSVASCNFAGNDRRVLLGARQLGGCECGPNGFEFSLLLCKGEYGQS